MLVICNNFLLKLAFASTCLCGPRKSKLRLKSELCKQQYTVTLFDFNHWAHVIVLWQMQKIYVLLYSFCFVLFLIWGQFPSTSPQGCVFGDAIYQRVFCVTSLGRGWGAYIWRGLFSEFYGRWQESIYLRMLRLQCSIIVEDAYCMHAYIIHWLGPIKRMTYVLLRRKNYLQLCITM